jgi:hypothetical protein
MTALASTETGCPVCSEATARVGVVERARALGPAVDLGRRALVPRKVVRLYRNTTEEWVKLTWAEGGEAKELVTTPGHHFLDRFGNFPKIEEMLENGRATVVLASGELTEVTAERIIYSAQTAHLFGRARVVGMISGNVAAKQSFPGRDDVGSPHDSLGSMHRRDLRLRSERETLVHRAKSGDLYARRQATWGMSEYVACYRAIV